MKGILRHISNGSNLGVDNFEAIIKEIFLKHDHPKENKRVFKVETRHCLFRRRYMKTFWETFDLRKTLTTLSSDKVDKWGESGCGEEAGV